MRNLQQDRADVESAQRAAREAGSWWTFLSSHPEVIPCEANRQVAISYHNGTEMTVESLNDSFNSPAFRSMLALQTTEEERAKALAEYHSVLVARGGSETAIESEFEKAKYLTVPQIQEKTDALRRHAEISKLPTPEIRKLANSRPEPEQVAIPSEFTRARLLELKGPELRRIIERYGSKAVTERLNQR